MIRDKIECELAATYLGISDTVGEDWNDGTRPYGCIYEKNGNNDLGWNSKKDSIQPCGTNYNCICAERGIVECNI